jgi:hypothetical protein
VCVGLVIWFECLHLLAGLHVHLPDTVVDPKAALALRRRLVSSLTVAMPGHNWDAAVDDGVYAAGRGIRMLGSRKVTKLKDVGRVYGLLLVVDTNGDVDRAPTCTPLEALQLTSLRP